MAALDVDPKIMAQIVNIMKTIADNGVPAVEIARVLSDGLMPQDMINLLVPQILDACGKEFQPLDVDLHVKFYDNLKLKANIPQDVIDFIDNKLIQVGFESWLIHFRHNHFCRARVINTSCYI